MKARAWSILSTATALAAMRCPAVIAGNGVAPAAWADIYDFMVQDVCIDSNGHPIVGLSPLNTECTRHRDLLPGEALPYHKADWPGKEDQVKQAAGYQRSDSFPFQSRMLGPTVVQTFDFGGGDRKFGQFDQGDGGQIVAFSRDSASVVLTEDGGRGLQLMAGSKCTAGRAAGPQLLDSWILIAKSSGAGSSGNTLARLRIVTEDSCPSGFDYAYTEWHIVNLRYRGSLDGSLTRPLHTLVSSHFGGQSVATAHHLERFYLTRELGLTRWERWQNTTYGDTPEQHTKARRLALSGRCSPLEAGPSESWLMTDCREWTNIVKADSTIGDPPDFWLSRLSDYPLTKDMFSN